MRLRTLGLEWADIEHLMALRRERERLAEQQWWAYVRCVRRRWYETQREANGHSHGALDSLLILVLFLLLGDVPKPQAAYSEPECLALFGPPDKAETEAFQGLAYAREQDLQTPQEIGGGRRSSVPPSAAPGWTVTSLYWKLRWTSGVSCKCCKRVSVPYIIRQNGEKRGGWSGNSGKGHIFLWQQAALV